MSGDNSTSRLYKDFVLHQLYLPSLRGRAWFQKLALGKPASFLRIIGNSEFSTMEEIGSWIPAVWSQRVPCAAIAAYDAREDIELLQSHDRSYRSKPIFGLYNSALFK